jgi:hypothetical protein
VLSYADQWCGSGSDGVAETFVIHSFFLLPSLHDYRSVWERMKGNA